MGKKIQNTISETTIREAGTYRCDSGWFSATDGGRGGGARLHTNQLKRIEKDTEGHLWILAFFMLR